MKVTEMKIIDLLNEVANGRIPHNVKLEGDCIFDLDDLYCCLSDADIGLNDTIEVIEEERKTLCKDEFNNCEIVIENKQLQSQLENYKTAWEELKQDKLVKNYLLEYMQELEQKHNLGGLNE